MQEPTGDPVLPHGQATFRKLTGVKGPVGPASVVHRRSDTIEDLDAQLFGTPSRCRFWLSSDLLSEAILVSVDESWTDRCPAIHAVLVSEAILVSIEGSCTDRCPAVHVALVGAVAHATHD